MTRKMKNQEKGIRPMRYIALLIHGINVHRPSRSVGKLKTFFEARGIPCIVVDYVHTGWMGARWKNRKLAKRVATITKAIKKNNGVKIIAVGHSNGCAIAHLATKEYAAYINYLVYINPALKRTLTPGPTVERCDVYHSPSDMPVKASKMLSKVTRFISKDWFDARPWGEMGAFGYLGDDDRMMNFDKENDSSVVSKSHSDMFQFDKIPFFGPVITNRIFDYFND
jgi:alpha-beta hydrolase superfamily lysophospholipase